MIFQNVFQNNLTEWRLLWSRIFLVFYYKQVAPMGAKNNA
jgi:hypothetical protein